MEVVKVVHRKIGKTDVEVKALAGNLVGAFRKNTFVLYYICYSISCDRYRESEDKMLALKQTIKDISKAKKSHS